MTHKIKANLELLGPETVYLIVIDGGSDWTATEEMITEPYPWISFMHCTSHEVSLIVKDCFKEDGGIPELVEIDEWVTDAQHWFSSHACKAFLKQQSHAGEVTSFCWPVPTRFVCDPACVRGVLGCVFRVCLYKCVTLNLNP